MCALFALTFVIIASLGNLTLHRSAGHSLPAITFQGAGDPVAKIGGLPDDLSNGTYWSLDASRSYDPDGIIVNYTWNITIGDATTFLWGSQESFMFKTLGLYKIILTVRDADGNTGTAFTAVYSIVDSDMDGLPDWWEVAYFRTTGAQSGGDDYDGDHYTNLQEYASGTNPTKKDPGPTLIQYLEGNWMYLAIVAAVIVAIVLALWPVMKKRRKQEEKRKIEAAIEIEKALEGEK